MSFASWYAHSIHLDTYYFVIVIYSIYFDVLIVLLDYSYSMLTSSYYMIFYFILYMYTLSFFNASFVMI